MPEALLIYGNGIKKEVTLDEIGSTIRNLEAKGEIIYPRWYIEKNEITNG